LLKLFILFILSSCQLTSSIPQKELVRHKDNAPYIKHPKGNKVKIFTEDLPSGSPAFAGILYLKNKTRVPLHADDQAEILYFTKGKGLSLLMERIMM
jgi:hypothetical protein